MNRYETVIDLYQVNYKVGHKYLLHDITWQVKRGEHWVVFGMNGSGKTTLLSMISGFLQQTKGKVELFGENFNNENIIEIRKRIGWVSASFFDKYYSKESALHIVLSAHSGTLGLDDDITLEDVRRAKALLTELNLGDRINSTFDTFSKGERQNILIARALFNHPDILILDEPCTGLDVYNRSYLFHTIEALAKKEDLTIIYVTHYVEEILPLFQKTILLKNGYIFGKGETSEMLHQEKISALLEYPVIINQNADGTYRLNVEAKPDLMRLL
ncbi:MAG: ATP-binding cassette domain-containing protein [Peptococcaceae bacterium]|nr:ATP-binding cassette domain-containing protein [Peptococcaceae bacterium]